MRKVYLDKLPYSNTGKSIRWDQSVGMLIPFEYDNKKGNIKVLDYKTDRKHPSVKVQYNENEKWIKTQTLKSCFIGSLIGVEKKEYLRNWKYKYKINESVGSCTIIDRKVEFDGKKHLKYYKYKCNQCGFDCGEHYYNKKFQKEVWFAENTITSLTKKCSCCSGRRIVVGINSISDTNPEMTQYFEDRNDANIYSKGSNELVSIKCPHCGYIRKKRIDALINNGFSCPKCGDGFSYPNKFMLNLLVQLNIGFLDEYMPGWLNGRRFDFYIPKLKIIIEMDGGLGHGRRTMGNITSEESLEIDQWKDKKAQEHKLKVVRIDSVKSELEYIKNNILNSELVRYLNLKNVNWNECDIFAKGSLYTDIVNYYNKTNDSTINISNKFNVSQNTVIRYLKYANKNNLCVFEPQSNMKKTQFKSVGVVQYNIFTRKCIQEFDSVQKASDMTNISYFKILNCCNRKIPIAGFYIWRFKNDDYDIINWNIKLLKDMHIKMVIQYDLNMNRLNIFENMVVAGMQTNTNHNSIRLCCNRTYKQAGGYIWRFIYDCDDVENKIHNLRQNGRRVIQYDYLYNKLATYISASEAADIIGVYNSGIIKCCNRKQKTCGGFIWRYEDDCDDMELKTFEVSKVSTIEQYNKDMILFFSYKNIAEAERKTGINRVSIYNCLNKKQKTAGGYIWKRIYKIGNNVLDIV